MKSLPNFKEVKALLNAGEYTKKHVEDVQCMNDVLDNLGDMFDFNPTKKWKNEMIKAYQDYRFKNKVASC